MLAFIDGILAEYEQDAVIVNVSGLGYRIFTTRVTAEVGERVKFYLSEVIREDKHDLYGFSSRDEKELFVLLTDVQGVGPKIGQKILAAATSEALRRHIQAGDLDFFTSISGVGKKTAQKIILDLKGVLVDRDTSSLVRDDVTDALENLGYSKEDIVAILPHVTGESPADRVKSALKLISRH
ncbi:MAG: Holliday junction branch migration protein RuvA [Patescibacteria group bacterium]